MRADRDGERACKFSRRSLRAGIVCAVSFAVIILCVILERVDGVAEWGARHISRPIVWLLGHITSAFSFSLFEVFVAIAVAGALSLIVVAIVYCANGFLRRGLSHLCVLAAVAFSVGAVYTVCTGFNYYRDPAPVPMAEQGEYTAAQYAEVGEMFFDEFAELLSEADIDEEGDLVSPYTPDELARVLKEEMKRLDDPSFGGYYSSYTPHFKSMLASEFMSQLNLTGITFVPLGEANVNVDVPTYQWVTTAAHELMHAKGVMNEGEANLVSYWLLMTSEDDFLRLCAMIRIAPNLISLAPPDGGATSGEWTEAIYAAGYGEIVEYNSKYWSRFDALGKLSNFFNDIYLKFSGLSGTNSYNDGAQFDGEKVPVVDDEGNQVVDPDTGDPLWGYQITAHSSIQRFVAKYYLG